MHNNPDVSNSGELHVPATRPAAILDLTATAVRALTLYSLAEFQSGHATSISITAEGSAFSIADDGRGHPIDKTVNGTSYLKFIYTHFDYPFESTGRAPVQLQGIGMSLLNAMCSELTLTVTKREEKLELWFRAGQLHQSDRTAVDSEATGTAVAGKINSTLNANVGAIEQLQAWLLAVLNANPSLKICFNGIEL
jgi:DNA gyrase/topoisomerase IV subunit B